MPDDEPIAEYEPERAEYESPVIAELETAEGPASAVAIAHISSE
jgi:hypothetical protein